MARRWNVFDIINDLDVLLLTLFLVYGFYHYTKQLKYKVDYPFIISGIEGYVLNDVTKSIVSHPYTAGVVILNRNIKSRPQLTDLINSIKRIKKEVIIAVDHEGGRVQLPDFLDFTKIPYMYDLARSIHNGLSLDAISEYAEESALDLRAIGVTLALGPVADLYCENSPIGKRAFSDSHHAVTTFLEYWAVGLKEFQFPMVLKHFPGIGNVCNDTHEVIAEDDRSLQELENDMLPFRNLAYQVKGIMTSHVIFSKVCALPVSLSKVWIKKLRAFYSGLIFSDDINMLGIKKMIPRLSDRIEMAIDAGNDFVLVMHENKELCDYLNGIPGSVRHTAASSRLI